MGSLLRIPFWSGAHEWAEDREAVHAALDAVAASGQWILGPEVDAFEYELATSLGVDEAVGVANGTDALTLALRAVGVRPGDHVVVPALTAVPTVAAVVAAGAVPVYADVSIEDACLDEAATDSVPDDFAALIYVHLHGRYARPLPLVTPGTPIVEDCAQALGARHDGIEAGAGGTAAALSFYPTKPLGGLGDGGAVATSDRAVAAEIRRLRQYGYDPWHAHWSHQVGGNSRLDEVHAAWLRVRIAKHAERLFARRRLATLYGMALREACAERWWALPTPHRDEVPAWYHYVVRWNDATYRRATGARQRSLVRAGLSSRGIGSAVAYAHLPPQMPPWRFGYRAGQCPVAERLADSMVSLPLWVGMTEWQVDEVVAALVAATEEALA
ncbi:MAG: DegT/DnrJ/EryC1/StrS family aminotransferase [bacterium]|nr:DegT/DnrJ/EryC1/StrS family aminotransferase [bacterium]